MSIILQRSVPINKFKLKEDEFLKGRCAEVYITNQNGFVLNCLLCDAKFRDLIMLKKHASAMHNYDCAPFNVNHFDGVMVKNEINTNNEHEQEILVDTDNVEYCVEEDIDNCSAKTASPPKNPIVNEVWTIIPYKDANDLGNTNNLDIINMIEFNESEAEDFDLNDADKQKIEISEKKDIKFEHFEETSQDEEKQKNTKATQVKVKVKKMERRIIGPLPEKRLRPNNSNSERIHICPICSFAFTDRSNLKAHINRHNGEKKFECPECTKRFFTRTEYDTHYRTHTGERPYICSSCGKGCLTAGELKVHERRHTNDRRYKCTYCEKRFFDGKHLKDHIVSHTQERNFVCDICNSRFLRRKSLKSHIKIHENKREYVCNICGNAYNQKPALSIHIRSKHGVHLHKADGEINKNRE